MVALVANSEEKLCRRLVSLVEYANKKVESKCR